MDEQGPELASVARMGKVQKAHHRWEEESRAALRGLACHPWGRRKGSRPDCSTPEHQHRFLLSEMMRPRSLLRCGDTHSQELSHTASTAASLSRTAALSSVLSAPGKQ